MRTRTTIAAFTIATLAGAAIAGPVTVNNGDIVYTSLNDNSIKLIGDPGNSNTLTNLLNYGGNFGQGNFRLAGITQASNGRFYVSNGPVIAGDDNWNTSAILEVTGLFSGAPVSSNFYAGQPVQNPVDIVYDNASDSLMWVQNPFRRTGPAQIVNDGIYGSPVAAPTANLLFAENTAGPRPFYEAGFYMTKDPNSSTYFVTALNGGTLPGPVDDNNPSTLWRFDPNTNNLTLIKDFSSDPALTDPMVQLRGITAVPGTNDLYVTNNARTYPGGAPVGATPGVYKVTLDAFGNYQSLTLINDTILQPEAIEYNPFTGKLVISSFNDVNNNGLSDDGIIYQMNLDGTGLEILVQGDFARDFYIVPTPGAFALLGLSGLAAIRRRRR